MKFFNISTFLLSVMFFVINTNNAKAQVVIGGQVEIKIGLPEIVIAKPRRAPQPKKPRPVIVKKRRPQNIPQPQPEPCYCNKTETLGTIMNQNNGPRFDYYVAQAHVDFLNNRVINLVIHLDTQDVLQITMKENNPNDYNFHYNTHSQANRIIDISMNNVSIPFNSAAVSLQPRGQNGYSAVLNLHSINDGDFNGTVKGITF